MSDMYGACMMELGKVYAILGEGARSVRLKHARHQPCYRRCMKSSSMGL